MEKIRIIIADDHPLMRSSIHENLTKANPNIEIIGQCCDGFELLDLLKFKKPDIIILDVEMPRMDGLEVLKLIREKYGDSFKILIFSANSSNYTNLKLMQLGAEGIIYKGSSTDDLMDAIYTVYKGSVHFNDSIAFKMLANSHNLKKASLSEFNDNDFEILRLLCEQKNAVEMAEELNMSVHTVNKHRSSLLQKTNSYNLAGMVIFAIQNGIYSLPKNPK
jgi:DNA-binding NarL/FixJ family response regulator